jgi:hypothetical protein
MLQNMLGEVDSSKFKLDTFLNDYQYDKNLKKLDEEVKTRLNFIISALKQGSQNITLKDAKDLQNRVFSIVSKGGAQRKRNVVLNGQKKK